MKNKIPVIVICLMLVTAGILYFLKPQSAGAPGNDQFFLPPSFVEQEMELLLPKPNDSIMSPFTLKGRVRGGWFFEASMPVTLYDANKNILVQIPVQAKGEWMTTDFIEFEESVVFKKPTTNTGFLMLAADNPSDKRELDKSFMIPVRFR